MATKNTKNTRSDHAPFVFLVFFVANAGRDSGVTVAPEISP
jgi:hypothetical protein